MIQERRAKYYHPGIARSFENWVTTCQEFIKNKRIDTPQKRPELISPTEFSMEPDDMQPQATYKQLAPSKKPMQHSKLRYKFKQRLERQGCIYGHKTS